MRLSEILAPEGVKYVSHVTSKKRLFHDLGDLAEDALGIRCQLAVDALMEREALGPTGVGHGVALPHARLDCIERVSGIFVRVERPIDFDAVDRQPVDLVFTLFAPADAGVEHLKALALVSRTMRDADVCTKLRANIDTASLHAILTEGPASKAA
ncbi:PTS sugar transporter subunit IIA [Aestuariibius sp. 2305UL40-4]|uniref:PTS sugar transporter subunit IIA n=1 Tax=Aestuariibius violaceus TaxID=3234132 RepID=UPI00345E30BF